MKKEFDTTQENAFQNSGAPKRRFMTKGKIIALSIVAVIVLLSVWDIFIDPPAFWHFRQADKQAIVQYQRQHYPGAKVIERNYPFLGNPHLVGVPVSSTMTFEYNGVKFVIAAQDGKISRDGYHEARATAQFDKIIKDGFLKPRKINSSVTYDFQDNYRETYPYTGSLYIELRARGSTPQEVGWLYDFYKYWKTAGSFLKEYRVNILIYESDVKVRCAVVIKNDSEFASEDEFYSAFEVY